MAGDYVPSVPRPEEVPSAWADTVLSTVSDVSKEEALEGADLGSRAIERLAGPGTDGRRKTLEVVITRSPSAGRSAMPSTHRTGAGGGRTSATPE